MDANHTGYFETRRSRPGKLIHVMLPLIVKLSDGIRLERQALVRIVSI